MDAMLSEEQKTILRAVEKSTLNHVVELIELHGLEVDETYIDYVLLKVALKRKHKSIVNFLLEKECRVKNENEINCDTPLHYAVELGDLGIIKKLLKKGASVIVKNSDEKTPLILAAEKLKEQEILEKNKKLRRNIKNDEIIRIMLSFYDFQNVHPINEQSLAHFHIACNEGTVKDIKNFVNCGFPVNSRAASSKIFNWNGNTPLHFAVEFFHTHYLVGTDEYELITYLLDNGADYSLMNDEKKTPIHLAYYLLQKPDAGEVIGTIFDFSLKKQHINSVDKFGFSHFHICCAINKPEVIEQFIKNGEDINCTVSLDSDKNSGYTPLHFAVQNCHENIAEILLKQGADVSLKSKNGSTPLHLACQLNQVKITRLLLKFGAKLTAQDNQGCTPLHCAFYKAQMNDLVSLLLAETPKDINYTNSEGLSIFHIACIKNNTKIVEHFIKQGVSPNLCTASDNKKYPGYSPMHFAVDYNKKSMVQLLLKYGADPNVNEKSRKITPLHTSCIHSHAKFYELIDQKHIDWTSHHKDHIDIVKLLLQHGADVNAKDSLGKTSLVYLCELSESPLINDRAEWSSWCTNKVLRRKYENEENLKREILKEVEKRIIDIAHILLSCDADLNACTDSGETILHAISKDNSITKDTAVKLAELFLKNKANVQIADQEKLTPLHTAVKNEKRHLVDIFLNNNANINARTAKLMTPLQIAILSYSLYTKSCDPIVELLLENGCDVNNQNLKGETALHLAISKLNYPIIKKLLCFGADINCKDARGCTPVFNLGKAMASVFYFDNKLLKLLGDHIEKLEMIGIRTDVKSKKCLLQLQEKHFSDNDDIHEDKTLSCEFELEKMKNTKVNQYTSLYNILFKDDIEMSRMVKNNHLKSILMDDQLEKKFPRYGDILKLKFRKGTEKIAILDNAKESLGYVTGFLLPDSCSERIFRYLTNNDLSTLIKLKSGVSRKRKMNSDSEKTEKSKTKQMRLEE